MELLVSQIAADTALQGLTGLSFRLLIAKVYRLSGPDFEAQYSNSICFMSVTINGDYSSKPGPIFQ
jgi:hypothetical protein